MPKVSTKKPHKSIAKDIVKKVSKKVPEVKAIPPKNFDLSIIIVSLNTKDLTKQTIESVLENINDLKVEIIVVDNASTDGSVEMLEKLGSKIILLKNQRNLGFGTANDRGARVARGHLLLFLNSDTLVSKGSLSKILEFMTEHNEVGIASPKIVNNDKEYSLQK